MQYLAQQSVNYYINNSQCKYSKYAIPRTAVSKLLHNNSQCKYIQDLSIYITVSLQAYSYKQLVYRLTPI